MKPIKTINVLCGLIILILAAQVCIPIYRFSVAFGYGISAGLEDAAGSTEMLEPSIPVEVTFLPTKNSYMAPPDSLPLSDHSHYPMLLTSGVVMMPATGGSLALYICGIVFSMLNIGVTIAVIVAFINFIISVNRGFVFDSVNVRRLARIGWLLIVASLLEGGVGLTRLFMTDLINFSSDSYILSSSWPIPFTDAMFGLFALMLATIWRRGLEMQDEQALTV